MRLAPNRKALTNLGSITEVSCSDAFCLRCKVPVPPRKKISVIEVWILVPIKGIPHGQHFTLREVLVHAYAEVIASRVRCARIEEHPARAIHTRTVRGWIECQDFLHGRIQRQTEEVVL